MFRYRLRTLVIVLAIGPPLLALILAYGDRPYIEFQRWLIREQPGGLKVVMPATWPVAGKEIPTP